MRSIPNKSDGSYHYVLTRPGQKSPKSGSAPSAGRFRLELGGTPPPQSESGIFCLSTVAAYGVILDFEASAVVIGGVRRFMAPREVEVLAALLFAEGEAVSVDEIYLACGFSAPSAAKSVVSRFIRRLRGKVSALGTIEATASGYRLSRLVAAEGFEPPTKGL